MDRFVRRARLGALLISLTAVDVIAAPATGSAATHFKTGSYVGRTSQGAKLKFLLRDISGCPGKSADKVTYCLGETVQANVNLKCPDGTKSNTYLDVSGSLSATGVLKQTTTGDEHIFVDLKVTPAGLLSGYAVVKAPETASPKPVCVSGTVKITAKYS